MTPSHSVILRSTLAMLSLATSPLAQATYYVTSCGDDSWSGTSATCFAPDGPKAHIQAAIDAAIASPTFASGDTVFVAPGQYYEAIDFRGSGVHVVSSGGAAVTTINASGLDTSVVRCASGEGPDSLLSGFTLTGGAGSTNPLFGTSKLGGGMLNEHSSPTVTHCIFLSNVVGGYGAAGGGMFNYFANPTVLECDFIGNVAGAGDPFETGLGGGVFNGGSSPKFTDCTFRANSSHYAGGGMYSIDGAPLILRCSFIDNDGGNWGSGGGMHNEATAPSVIESNFSGNTAQLGCGMSNSNCNVVTITDCTFTENKRNASDGWGGGMYNAGANVTLTRCTFDRNSSPLGGGLCFIYGSQQLVNCRLSRNEALLGGGILNAGSNMTLVNCIVQGNLAATHGGGILNQDAADSTLIQCTLTENGAGDGSGIFNTGNTVIAKNCIIWNNFINPISGSAVISFSDVEGGFAGSGNIDIDPMFEFWPDGIYRLLAGSPCIDAASNLMVLADSQDLDADGDILEAVPLDIDGLPRFVADPATPDTGIAGYGHTALVDMGAHEFQPPPAQVWTDIGFGLAGTNGIPGLAGTGSLVAGSTGSVALTSSKPLSQALLLLSLSNTPTPFKGGTLIPVPVVVSINANTDTTGSFMVPFVWPFGVPSLTSLYFQYAIQDPAAPQGVALSNALEAITP